MADIQDIETISKINRGSIKVHQDWEIVLHFKGVPQDIRQQVMHGVTSAHLHKDGTCINDSELTLHIPDCKFKERL